MGLEPSRSLLRVILGQKCLFMRGHEISIALGVDERIRFAGLYALQFFAHIVVLAMRA